MPRPSRILSALIKVAIAVSRNTGATASWMTWVMSVRCDSRQCPSQGRDPGRPTANLRRSDGPHQPGARRGGRAFARRVRATFPLQSAPCARSGSSRYCASRSSTGSTSSCSDTNAFTGCGPTARVVTFWRDTSGAARACAAPGAAGSRADLRQVRTDAVDAARPAADRHRRRAGQAAGPGAAVSVRRR